MRPALLHLFGGLADAHLGGAADVQRASLAEGAEEAVEKDLGLALLVAGDVLLRPVDEIGEELLALGHADVCPCVRERLEQKISGSGGERKREWLCGAFRYRWGRRRSSKWGGDFEAAHG